MFLRMIYDDKLAAAAYLIGCQRTGEAIIIDPQRDVDRYEGLAAANGLRLIAAAETHIHADFLSGSRELAERGAKVYLSAEGGPDWQYQWLDKKAGGGGYAHQFLRDGDTFRIGNIEFKALHTPGHTPEHICFLITDRGGGATEPMGIATGDFVFVGDLGRPDLLESAAGFEGQADPSAHQLFASVRTFVELPEYLQVWPAHGAGSACGKALGAVPTTTVGYEKRFNPAIRAATSENDFVRHILAGQPEPPLYFANMKRLNRAGPPVIGNLPRPRRLSPGEIADLNPRAGGHAALIDTRPWAAFKSGHLPGALHLPLNRSFTTDTGSLIDERETIVILVEPARLEEAIRDLIRIGLDRIVGWFDPSDLDRYTSEGGKLIITPEIPVAEARDLLEGGRTFALDVRRASEFDEGHIPGSTNIAHTRLRSRLDEVPRDRHILVNCRSGARSARACSLLQKHGYECTNLAGGFLAWELANAGAER